MSHKMSLKFTKSPCNIDEGVLTSSWLWVKVSTGGSVNYDFIKLISLSDIHTPVAVVLQFLLSPVKELRRLGL